MNKKGLLFNFVSRLLQPGSHVPRKHDGNPPLLAGHDILAFFNIKIIAAGLHELLHMTGRLLSYFPDKEILAPTG